MHFPCVAPLCASNAPRLKKKYLRHFGQFIYFLAPYEERGRHFVQLYAFRDEARAWAQKQYWQGRLSRQVWVGVAPGEAAPFKVLVGPFAQLQDARRFLRSERLDGFPREQRDIRLYED